MCARVHRGDCITKRQAQPRRQARRSPNSMASPSTAANTNGQYEPFPLLASEVPSSTVVVVVCATGRVSISLSETPSGVVVDFAASPEAMCARGRGRCVARAGLAASCEVEVGDGLDAAVRAFLHGAGRSGYGFLSSATSACAVTHTGVCALERE